MLSRVQNKVDSLRFSESHQQHGNSADRILLPKIFCGLTDQSVLAHTNMPLKSCETV